MKMTAKADSERGVRNQVYFVIGQKAKKSEIVAG